MIISNVKHSSTLVGVDNFSIQNPKQEYTLCMESIKLMLLKHSMKNKYARNKKPSAAWEIGRREFVKNSMGIDLGKKLSTSK